MNILLSKKLFDSLSNIVCHIASTLNCSVFISQICTGGLLDLFFPFLLLTKYFFFHLESCEIWDYLLL